KKTVVVTSDPLALIAAKTNVSRNKEKLLFLRILKEVEADDQAIQTILLGLPEDIYAAINSCETAQESGYVFN
nr:hypothetical protein [Tanacetum cinerariifolium]